MTEFETKISLMIPALLRGDLTDADANMVEAAIADNESLREDFNFQKMMREELQASKPTRDDLGWARLSKSIDALEDRRKDPPQLAANDQGPAKIWRRAAIALGLVCVAQLSLIGLGFNRQSDSVQYLTVSDDGVAGTVQLAPLQGLDMEALTEMLNDSNGQIVSGPSALGLYTISFDDIPACEAALSRLESISESVSNCS